MRLIDADKLIHSIDSAISLREKMGRKNNYSLINLKKLLMNTEKILTLQSTMPWFAGRHLASLGNK